MLRSDFIKGIIGFLGVSVLPQKMLKHYQRIYLYQSFIRGFRFYSGPKLLDEMSEGDLLEMVREPENKYDTKAIALYFNKHKIGFLPQEDNEIFSKLMDADIIKLQAEITHLEKEAKAWENVHVGVYVLKETDNPLPDTAMYLTILETPHYHTVKMTKDKVTTVYFDNNNNEELIIDGDAFYDKMVESAKDDSVYDILHGSFRPGDHLQEIISEGRIILNQKRLPKDLQNDSLTQALDEGIIVLNDIFDEGGYIVAKADRVAGLSSRIEKVVETVDKTGRCFYEFRFQ